MAADDASTPFQRAVGLLLVLLVGISLPIALTLRSFSAQLFTPDRFESALVRNLTATGALRRLAIREILSETGPGTGGLQQLTADMREQEVDELLRLLVPDSWWEEQLRSGVDAFFDWIDSEAPTPEVTLDLEPIRTRLLGQPGEQAVDLVMSSWPACTPSQFETLIAQAQGSGDIPEERCLPPEPYESLLRGALLEGLREEAGSMPASVDVGPSDEASEDVTEFSQLKRNLRTARWLGRWGWMVPVALLGLIMAVNVRSLKSWGIWWGVPLMSAGALSLVIALILAGPVETRLMGVLATFDAPDVLRNALSGVIRDLFRDSLGRLMFGGIATGGIGLVAVLIGVFAPDPSA